MYVIDDNVHVQSEEGRGRMVRRSPQEGSLQVTRNILKLLAGFSAQALLIGTLFVQFE